MYRKAASPALRILFRLPEMGKDTTPSIPPGLPEALPKHILSLLSSFSPSSAASSAHPLSSPTLQTVPLLTSLCNTLDESLHLLRPVEVEAYVGVLCGFLILGEGKGKESLKEKNGEKEHEEVKARLGMQVYKSLGMVLSYVAMKSDDGVRPGDRSRDASG